MQDNPLARLKENPDYKILEKMMLEQFEAHKNELENKENPTIQFTQGIVFTYRNIFNWINEYATRKIN